MIEPNPRWDEQLMDLRAWGQLQLADAMLPTEMAREAGNTAHEVHTWLAAFSALRAAGPYTVTSRFYRPIRELIAGFRGITAVQAGPQ